MKKILLVLVGFMCLSLMSIHAAQACPNGMSICPFMVAKNAQQLGLSADQQAKVEGVKRELTTDIEKAKKDLGDTQERLHKVLDQKSPNLAGVKALMVKEGQLRGLKQYAQVKANLKMKTILTADQTGKYEKLAAKTKGAMGCKKGCDLCSDEKRSEGKKKCDSCKRKWKTDKEKKGSEVKKADKKEDVQKGHH